MTPSEVIQKRVDQMGHVPLGAELATYTERRVQAVIELLDCMVKDESINNAVRRMQNNFQLFESLDDVL